MISIIFNKKTYLLGVQIAEYLEDFKNADLKYTEPRSMIGRSWWKLTGYNSPDFSAIVNDCSTNWVHHNSKDALVEFLARFFMGKVAHHECNIIWTGDNCTITLNSDSLSDIDIKQKEDMDMDLLN